MQERRSFQYPSKAVALVLAGGRGSRLFELTDRRAKPAVYFGGKYRIVDFAMSNCVNSGIRRIGVLTQYKSHSLLRHLQRGWGFLRGETNEFVDLLPAQQRIDEEFWYRGTADAVYQNIDILSTHKPTPEYVVILAGDHCQLPPTIKCIEAARGGLGRTLLEKVVLHKPETVSLLKIQYRMHEDIMRFPSRWFYHDELEAAPEVKYRGILDFDTPASWIDTSELDLQEKAVAEGTGRLNTGEAELLVRELKNYMERIGIRRILEEHIDFGVISPYRAQVHYLRHLLKKEPFFRPCRRLITVHTVDGFQGQERDVIMISLVRANEKGQIGFLRDLRRMNVAITRARMKLLILGEAVTLTRHPFYRELYEYIGGLR